jgi:quinolinate synthase
VVQNADYSGSTEYIVRTISAAGPGSVWGVGTEKNLVYRLARQWPDRRVILLQEKGSLCRTMALVTPVHLLYQLECLRDGKMVNQVVADDNLRKDALAAVERMLSLKI